MKNKYTCDCCGKETDINEIIFHYKYAIGICNSCYNKMGIDTEYSLWHACFYTADTIHYMLKKLNNKKTF